MKCKDVQADLLDYLEGVLDEMRTKEMEEHIQECEGCRMEMNGLKQVIASLESGNDSIVVPEDFMTGVRARISITQKGRRTFIPNHRRRVMMGMAAALFLLVFMGTAVATNGFESVMDWWKDSTNKQSEQVESYIQQGLGEKVNLVAESNGVKVTITSVVADDIQTLIYYEVEDRKKENKYGINFTEGLKIANQDRDWDKEDDSTFSPINSSSALYSEKDYVYKGELGALPMSADEGTIQLELTKLEKMINQSSEGEGSEGIPGGSNEFIEGKWHFDIPVKKHPALVYAIKKETKIEGNPVIFDKVTIAPTATILTYRYRNDNDEKNMEYLQMASIESDGTFVYPIMGSGGGGGSAAGWNSTDATFESLYFDQPKEIRVHMGPASFFVEDSARFEIDPSKELPQTFEYLGSGISIDSIKVGKPTEVVMTEELKPKRKYETLHFHFYDKDGQGSSGNRRDGYYRDKEGHTYKASENFHRLNELEQPRFFSTDHQIELSTDDGKEPFAPIGIEIEGYSITTFYDQVIEIPLD
ncbi:DUF4179 domain-containing protein [Peribacillus sp. NPDC046944]|uniref:DUF4179 domain-containing protein n=1 Tax=unclassified Peribacillus TaxID=2675266 RepID=UPI003D00B32D